MYSHIGVIRRHLNGGSAFSSTKALKDKVNKNQAINRFEKRPGSNIKQMVGGVCRSVKSLSNKHATEENDPLVPNKTKAKQIHSWSDLEGSTASHGKAVNKPKQSGIVSFSSLNGRTFIKKEKKSQDSSKATRPVRKLKRRNACRNVLGGPSGDVNLSVREKRERFFAQKLNL